MSTSYGSAGGGAIIPITGAPSAGTNEVQTLTIGGTPTGGTFKLAYEGNTTTAITWSSTNSTLLANIQAALDALRGLGTNWVVASDSTLTAGIGNLLLTFSGGDVARKAVPLISVANNSLTGSAPTLANAETTPGVTATHRDAPRGTVIVRSDGGLLYVNTSATAGQPTWTAQV